MNVSATPQTMHILQIEDNTGDVLLLRAALSRCSTPTEISVATNGGEALAMLHRRPPHGNFSLPHLILLDVNLPPRNGFDVLAEIKRDPQLRRIPVIMLSSSHAEDDVARSYDLHANGFIVKPLDLEQFRQLVRAIEGFWFNFVNLPRVCNRASHEPKPQLEPCVTPAPYGPFPSVDFCLNK